MGRHTAAITIMVLALLVPMMVMAASIVSADPFPPTVSEPTSVKALPGQNSITLTWEQPEIGYITATGFSIYRSIDDVDYTLLEVVERDVFSFEDDTIIVGRTFYYYLRTNSDLGQSVNSEKISSTADNEPPDLEIISPDMGEYLGIDDVVVRLNLYDELSDITSVTYELNDEPPVEIGEIDTIHLTDLDDGEHLIMINATDQAGNHRSTSGTFFVDTTIPDITITTPFENELLSTDQVTIEWESSDVTSFIQRTELSVDSGPFLTVDNQGPHTLTYLRSDDYTVRLRVFDPAGNSMVAWRNFTVDGDSPSIEILEDEESMITNKTSYEIEWEGSDPTTDYFFESKIDTDPWVIENKDRSRMLAGLDEGSHWFQVRITDGVGYTAEDGMEIIVDISPPILDDLVTGRSFQGTLPLKFSVFEEFTYVDIIFYSINRGNENVIYQSRWSELIFDEDHPLLIEDLPHGDVEILIGAVDGAGNRVEKTITTFVDLEPPEIIEVDPNGTISVRPDMIEIRFDENVDPDSVQISGIGDQGTFDVKGSVVEIFSEFPFEFGHSYSFRIIAMDRFGNVMRSQDIEIRITDMVLLTGWILDEKGKGMRDVLITLDNGRYTFTEEDGSYSIETKMGNITVYASKNGFKTRSTQMFARPDRDNSVRVMKLEKDKGTFISRITSFFDDPVNLIFMGIGFLLLMFISFVFFRYRDRIMITEVDIEMEEELSEDTLEEDLQSNDY